ncbi:MAG: DUF5683 domain-containing protein [Chitinophagales bacterium]
MKLVFFFLVTVFHHCCFAQIENDSVFEFEEDTTFVNEKKASSSTLITKEDSTIFFQDLWSHNPHSIGRAALFSAILPGLGQVYNGKAWKVPIVYTGLGIATGFVIYYRYGDLGYLDLKEAVQWRFDGDSTTIDKYEGLAGDEQLVSLLNQTKRYQDLSYISLSFVYLLNIVDAIVDAHLYDFDVSDDLSMRILPDLNIRKNFRPTSGISTFAPALGIQINLYLK